MTLAHPWLSLVLMAGAEARGQADQAIYYGIM